MEQVRENMKEGACLSRNLSEGNGKDFSQRAAQAQELYGGKKLDTEASSLPQERDLPTAAALILKENTAR